MAQRGPRPCGRAPAPGRRCPGEHARRPSGSPACASPAGPGHSRRCRARQTCRPPLMEGLPLDTRCRKGAPRARGAGQRLGAPLPALVRSLAGARAWEWSGKAPRRGRGLVAKRSGGSGARRKQPEEPALRGRTAPRRCSAPSQAAVSAAAARGLRRPALFPVAAPRPRLAPAAVRLSPARAASSSSWRVRVPRAQRQAELPRFRTENLNRDDLGLRLAVNLNLKFMLSLTRTRSRR
jgi:hypothetical protein